MKRSTWFWVIGILTTLALYNLGAYFSRQNTTAVNGVVVTRETYVSSCRYWAKQDKDIAELSDTIINSYCGCTYDKGVAKYGEKEFTRIDQEITKTNTITPEMNVIVNQCVQQALGQ